MDVKCYALFVIGFIFLYAFLLYFEKEYLASNIKILILFLLFLAEALDLIGILNLTNPNDKFQILSVILIAFFLLEITDTFFDMKRNQEELKKEK